MLLGARSASEAGLPGPSRRPLRGGTHCTTTCHHCGRTGKAVRGDNGERCPNPTCNIVFCERCAEKAGELGVRVLHDGGCVVCHHECCCNNELRCCANAVHCQGCVSTKVAKIIRAQSNLIMEGDGAKRAIMCPSQEEKLKLLGLVAGLIGVDTEMDMPPFRQRFAMSTAEVIRLCAEMFRYALIAHTSAMAKKLREAIAAMHADKTGPYQKEIARLNECVKVLRGALQRKDEERIGRETVLRHQAATIEKMSRELLQWKARCKHLEDHLEHMRRDEEERIYGMGSGDGSASSMDAE